MIQSNTARERCVRLLARFDRPNLRRNTTLAVFILSFLAVFVIAKDARGDLLLVASAVGTACAFAANRGLLHQSRSKFRAKSDDELRRELDYKVEEASRQDERSAELQRIEAQTLHERKRNRILSYTVILAFAGALFATNPSETKFKEHYQSERAISIENTKRSNFLFFSIYTVNSLGIRLDFEEPLEAGEVHYIGILTQFIEL